jgi:hypothetical protein
VSAPDWRATARALLADVATMDVVTLVTSVTLLNLMVGPVGRWYVRPAVLALAATGLLLPRAARLASLWWWLCWLTALRVLGSWPQVDNHAYLLSYWCLALALAHGSPSPRDVLAVNGRVLIGLVFLLATLQKACSPDYIDGRFFRFTLVTDPRFSSIAQLVGRMDEATLDQNRALVLTDRHGTGPARPFIEPQAFRRLVFVSTWAVVMLEALVAVAFLSRRPAALHRARDALLVGFCLITYAVAPVPGFGWLLVVMGLAQADDARPRLRWAYLGAWAVILVYEYVPWATLALNWTRP